jgi:hypothetical protein
MGISTPHRPERRRAGHRLFCKVDVRDFNHVPRRTTEPKRVPKGWTRLLCSREQLNHPWSSHLGLLIKPLPPSVDTLAAVAAAASELGEGEAAVFERTDYAARLTRCPLLSSCCQLGSPAVNTGNTSGSDTPRLGHRRGLPRGACRQPGFRH